MCFMWMQTSTNTCMAGLKLQEASVIAKRLMGVTLRVAHANPGDMHAAFLGSKGCHEQYLFMHVRC